MKNLRKVLAVVLVVAMAFSLMVMASAKNLSDYSDAASVTNKEAVDVMIASGVMTGDGSTGWNPTGTFTREQAAKVVASLLSANAGKFVVTKSSFTDVKATDWAAPYIEYAVSKGVIGGRGDGTFGPKDPVTGSQMAVMLLKALGYGKNNEFASNWEINAIDLGLEKGILSGTADFSKPATREQVAQYCMNAVTKEIQSFDKDTELYSTTNVELGAKIGLTSETSNVNGVTGHYWALKTVAITSVYVDDIVLLTSKDGSKVSAFTSTSSTKYIAPLVDGADYTWNGTPVPVLAHGAACVDDQLYVGTDEILRVADGVTTDYDAAGGNDDVEYSVKGAIVNLIDDPATVAKDVFKVNIIEKKVGYIDPAGTGVTVTPVLNLPANVKIDMATDITGTEKTVVGYAGLAKGDVILYYTLGTTTYVEKASSFTGTVTAIAGSTYTIGGSTYTVSNLVDTSATITLGNTTATYWVDNGGFIVYTTGPASVVATNYAMVVKYVWTAADSFNGIAASSKALILLPDGTSAVYTLLTAGGTAQNDSLVAGQLIKYIASGTTITTVTPVTADVNDDPIDIDRYDTSVVINSTTNANDGTYYLTSGTIFFYAEGAADGDLTDVTDSYGVVIGNTNVKDDSQVADTDTFYFEATSAKVMKAIVLTSEFTGAASGTPTYAYVVNATPTQTLETVNGVANVTVYSYSAYVNGAATTIKTTNAAQVTAGGTGVYTITPGANGLYTFSAEATYAEANEDVTVADSTFAVVDGVVYSIGATTKVYQATLDTTGAIATLTAAPLALSATQNTFATVVDDGSDNALYIVFWYAD